MASVVTNTDGDSVVPSEEEVDVIEEVWRAGYCE